MAETVTMYAANVFEFMGHPVGLTGLRCVKPTEEEAKAVLDAEARKAGYTLPWEPVPWGIEAKCRGLLYEVGTVQVTLPDDCP